MVVVVVNFYCAPLLLLSLSILLARDKKRRWVAYVILTDIHRFVGFDESGL